MSPARFLALALSALLLLAAAGNLACLGSGNQADWEAYGDNTGPTDQEATESTKDEAGLPVSPDPDYPHFWGRYAMTYFGGKNATLAAELIDGTVIKNGTTFRGSEHLWGAPYINGAYGICDNSTVLFRLAVRTGLDAQMRTDGDDNTTHYSYEKVRYYGWPMDEAVVWKDGSSNMAVKFDNDSGYDMYIAMSMVEGRLETSFFGKGPLKRKVDLIWENRIWGPTTPLTLLRKVYDKQGRLLGEGRFTSRYTHAPGESVRDDFFAPYLTVRNTTFELLLP